MTNSEDSGRYVDWQHIGKGGTADVFRAFDAELKQTVAIKVLHEQHSQNVELVEGLRREVLISRWLRHPQICPIHDIYEGPKGFGIVMDLLEGSTLREWMDANAGRLRDTLPQRLQVLRKIADALAVAHGHPNPERRIVHRDLKPANIFLHGGDIAQPVILDFGISLVGGVAEGEFAGGTLKYMAPEQLTPPYSVDHRTDLYAFAVMAYEILTAGRLPESSNWNYMKTRQVQRVPVGDITRPSAFCDAIAPGLDRLIVQMLAASQADRPASTSDVVELLLRTGQETLDRLAGGGEVAGPAAVASGRNPGADRVAVPEGDYFIGSAGAANNPNELPIRRIRLCAYQIDAVPVTVARFAAFLDSTGYQRPPDFQRQTEQPDCPVTGVNWEDANAFAKWAGGFLPSEAQWEVAAKAGEKLREYPWGDEPPSPSMANIDGTVGRPTPVHDFSGGRNAWGMWDACGNVWEWCADGWDPNLYRSFANGAVDPVSAVGGAERAIRGGSYESFVTQGRCAARHAAPADDRRPDIGFRVAYML
jgi:formylglycine-generating enzyme required for sulfatase activity